MPVALRAGGPWRGAPGRADPLSAAHPFDEATAVSPAGEDGRWRARLDPAWFGSAAPHGGIIAAQLLAAMSAHVGGSLPARSLTVHYTSAASEGPLDIVTAVERAGRSLTTASARATQGGTLVALALAALGRDRSGPSHRDATAPAVPSPQELDPPPEGELTAPVRDHFDLRFADGFPGSGGAAASGGWIRPARPRPADDRLTAALTDLWVPAILAPLPDSKPMTTVELTVNFLNTPDGLPDDGWYLTRFAVPVAAHGYFREEGEVWGGDGRLLARSSQLAAFLASS